MRFIPSFHRFITLLRLLGVRRGITTWWHLYTQPTPIAVAILLPGEKDCRQVYLRGRGADFSVFRQVVLEGVYERFVEPLSPDRVTTIIDAGAHIGCASLMLHARFPNARILAIEPDPENFKLLRMNTAEIPNISCLHTAIWSSDGELRIAQARGLSTWGTQMVSPDDEAASSISVPARTIPSILQGNDMTHVDLLKLDIEGAEREIFSPNCATWLTNVRTMVVEVHERMYPGCEEAVRRALKGYLGTLHIVNE